MHHWCLHQHALVAEQPLLWRCEGHQHSCAGSTIRSICAGTAAALAGVHDAVNDIAFTALLLTLAELSPAQLLEAVLAEQRNNVSRHRVQHVPQAYAAYTQNKKCFTESTGSEHLGSSFSILLVLHLHVFLRLPATTPLQLLVQPSGSWTDSQALITHLALCCCWPAAKHLWL